MQLAGALGCIILDNGSCESFNQKCLPGSTKDAGEYFGDIDPPNLWY